MTNINKDTKVRLATITEISTSLSNDSVPGLSILVVFSYSDGSVCKGFYSSNLDSMIQFSTLFYYTNTDKLENVDSLKNKQVRVVITNGRLTAIGHPTEDEFFQFHEYDTRLPLSEVI